MHKVVLGITELVLVKEMISAALQDKKGWGSITLYISE